MTREYAAGALRAYDQFTSVAELKQQLNLLDGRVKDVKDQQKLF